MMRNRMRMSMMLSFCAAFLLALSACSNTTDEKKEDMKGVDHSNMNMSGSGEVPEGLKIAENPTYKVGSKAMIESDHMEGMKGAEATIVGAYDTTVYTISYTPKTGGERVENHKWVTESELSSVE